MARLELQPQLAAPLALDFHWCQQRRIPEGRPCARHAARHRLNSSEGEPLKHDEPRGFAPRLGSGKLLQRGAGVGPQPSLRLGPQSVSGPACSAGWLAWRASSGAAACFGRRARTGGSTNRATAVTAGRWRQSRSISWRAPGGAPGASEGSAQAGLEGSGGPVAAPLA